MCSGEKHDFHEEVTVQEATEKIKPGNISKGVE